MATAVPKLEFSSERKNQGIGGRKSGRSAKDSGQYFEKMTEGYFTDDTTNAKRVLGSGALGKIMKDPTLLGDVVITYAVLDKPILAECKFGYGGNTQLSLKRHWFEKIAEEAALTNKYPAVIGKFKGARGDNTRFIAFSWETWKEIMDAIANMVKTYEELT